MVGYGKKLSVLFGRREAYIIGNLLLNRILCPEESSISYYFLKKVAKDKAGGFSMRIKSRNKLFRLFLY